MGAAAAVVILPPHGDYPNGWKAEPRDSGKKGNSGGIIWALNPIMSNLAQPWGFYLHGLINISFKTNEP